MMVDMGLLSDLNAIGFTDYEAKVYLALLRVNPATGYQISKQAGIPRSMVYEALGRLDARGAVLKTEEHRATLYRPLPPSALLERHERSQSHLLERLRSELKRLYAERDEDRFWSISGRESVLSYARQLIQGASEEVMLVLSDLDLEALREVIEAACQSELHVETLLTGDGELACGQVARHPPLESKVQQLTDTLVVVTDSRKALISSAGAEPMATVTNNGNLVAIARQFVWMELFAQRIYKCLGPDLLQRIDPEDRQILEGFGSPEVERA